MSTQIHTHSLSEFHKKTLLCYKGPFDGHMLVGVGSNIRTNLGHNQADSKRIFAIFIEMAQNVSNYSYEKIITENGKYFGVGTFFAYEQETNYTFITGNIVSYEDAVKLAEKGLTINSLDKTGLHQYKRAQWRLPRRSKRGANIGLIQIALTSENPINITIDRINEQSSFFTLTVTVNKQTH